MFTRCLFLLFMLLVALCYDFAVVVAQSSTTTPVPPPPPPSTTTTTTTSIDNSTTSNVTTTSAATAATTTATASPTSTSKKNLVGDGVYIETNTSLNPTPNTCMSLNSKLTHPDLRQPGAKTHGKLCIPTTVASWNLQNGTVSVNRDPSGRELSDCIATCSMEYRPRAATVTVVFMFGQCYCWSSDFHDASAAADDCCKDGLEYLEYVGNTQDKCREKMFGAVYTTTLLCPLNESMCGSSPANKFCEVKKTKESDSSVVNFEAEVSCCVPKGSLTEQASWGVQVAQYTIIFICTLALFQILYWILRKRPEDDEDGSGSGSRPSTRLLVVPMLNDADPVTVTQTNRHDQQSSIAAAKEIIGLFPVLTTQQVTALPEGEDDCCICLDPLASQRSVRICCNHLFHYSCLLTYLAHKLHEEARQINCPHCRAVAVDASVNYENGNNNSTNNNNASGSAASSPTTTTATAAGAAAAAATTSSARRSSTPAQGRATGAVSAGNPLESSLLGRSPRDGSSAAPVLPNIEMQPIPVENRRARRDTNASRSTPMSSLL